MKTHREYIDEQIRKKPSFAGDSAEAEKDVALAVALAKLRERRGLSQTELAKRVGMKQPQLARLESGAQRPGIGTLIRLLGALDGTLELSATTCRLTPTKGASSRRVRLVPVG